VKPSYLMWLEWTDGRISFIRDYKYVRYVVDDAELVLAPDTAPPGERKSCSPRLSDGRQSRALLIDGATLASVIGKKLSISLQCVGSWPITSLAASIRSVQTEADIGRIHEWII
jgi:hypothetical protein